MRAVPPIASVPQNVTRIAATITPAPPSGGGLSAQKSDEPALLSLLRYLIGSYLARTIFGLSLRHPPSRLQRLEQRIAFLQGGIDYGLGNSNILMWQ